MERHERLAIEAAGPTEELETRTVEQLERSRIRWRRTALGLGMFGAFWLLGLADPDLDTSAVLGLALIEGVLAIPFAYSLWRMRDLRKRIKRRRFAEARVAGRAADAQEQIREIDEVLIRLGRMVDGLPPALQRSRGSEAFTIAAQTAQRWREVEVRIEDLRHLESTLDGERRERVKGRRRAAMDDARRLDAALDDLVAALAELDGAANASELTRLDERVRESEERLRLLAESLEELERNPALPDDDEAPGTSRATAG